MKSVKYYWREITEYDKVFKYLSIYYIMRKL